MRVPTVAALVLSFVLLIGAASSSRAQDTTSTTNMQPTPDAAVG